MIIKTDKNLGPAIIDREQYVLHKFQDHLSNTNAYQHLHPSATSTHIKKLKTKLNTFIELNFPDNHPDRTFLSCSLQNVTDPYAFFTSLLKSKKNLGLHNPLFLSAAAFLKV
jgi:hypothetical protein